IDFNTIPANSSIAGFEVRVKAFQTIGRTDNLAEGTPTALLSRISRVNANGQRGSGSRILELNHTRKRDSNAVEHVLGGHNDAYGLTDYQRYDDIFYTLFYVDFLRFYIGEPNCLIIDLTIFIDCI